MEGKALRIRSSPETGDLKPVDIKGATLRRAKRNWYRDHPLCGSFLGCNTVCPYSTPMIREGVLFPHCNHPDQGKYPYRP